MVRIPISSTFAKQETGRVVVGIKYFTLSFSTQVNGGCKDQSHECIEILYTCECCGSSKGFIAEIQGDGDMEFNCGYYTHSDTMHITLIEM